MATIVDELVTILGITIAADAMLKTTKFGQALETVAQYATAASAAITAATVAIAAFTNESTQSAAELDKFSQLTGMQSSSLQEWSYAAKQAGGSAQSLRSDILHLTKDMKPLLPGEFNMGLFMLLGDYTKYKKVDDLMSAIAGKFKGMNAQRALQWGSKIGLSEGTVLLLQKGADGIDKLRKEAQALGAIIPDEELKKAREFQMQMDRLKDVLSVIGQSVAAKISPAFKRIAQNVEDWVKVNKEFIGSGIDTFVTGVLDAMSRFSDVVHNVVTWLVKAFPALAGFFKGLDKINLISTVLVGVLTVVAGVIGFFIAKFALIGAAIVAVGILVEDFFTYLEGGKSIFGELIEAVTKTASTFAKRFPEIAEFINLVWRLLAALGKIGFELLVASLKLIKELLIGMVENGGLVLGVFEMIFGVINKIIRPVIWLVELFASIVKPITDAYMWLVDMGGIIGLIGTGVSKLGGVFISAFDGVLDLITPVYALLQKLASLSFQTLANAFKGVWAVVKDLAGYLGYSVDGLMMIVDRLFGLNISQAGMAGPRAGQYAPIPSHGGGDVNYNSEHNWNIQSTDPVGAAHESRRTFENHMMQTLTPGGFAPVAQ